MNRSIIIYSFAFLFLLSCGEKKQEAATAEAHEHASEENTTFLTEEQLSSIEVTLGSIEKKQLTASLRANGLLKVPNQNRADVNSLLGGVVRSILVQPGNKVRKGQVVATIANTGFISMQEEYLSVSSKVTLAEADYSRQKELQAGNAGALKNLQASEAELKGLKARKGSLQKQLELIGISVSNLTNENIQSVVNVKSPIDGVVSEVLVNMGSFVDANNTLMSIIDNSQLHLDLYVYEKDLSKLKTGQIIHFTLTNNAGKEYDAVVFGIGNTFEQNTKAIAIHAKVEGDKSGLIDGMNITALVSLEDATVNAVPNDAIVSSEGLDYIFIVSETPEEHHHAHAGEEAHSHEHSDDTVASAPKGLAFEKIPVRKGTSEVGYSEITLLKDIPANSKIVTKGAFFILAKMKNTGEAHHH